MHDQIDGYYQGATVHTIRRLRYFPENVLLCSTFTSLQCESKKSPCGSFSDIFPKRTGIFLKNLHTYYTFLFTLNCKFLFNYLQL